MSEDKAKIAYGYGVVVPVQSFVIDTRAPTITERSRLFFAKWSWIVPGTLAGAALGGLLGYLAMTPH